MKVLLTGGAGYIGSHTAVELLNKGNEVVIFDNFSNSSPVSIKRVEQITGRSVPFVQGDVRAQPLLEQTLREHAIDSVVHFAGKKAVGESVAQPIDYFDNNVNGTLVLIRAMEAVGVKRLVFSSSATVYGDPEYLPLDELHPLSVTNPYGRSKLMVEEILSDLYVADSTWALTVLRYFNPIGAHESGLIGEDPAGIPNNLLPFVAQVAVGKRACLNVFGGDYQTVDGTGVRDYIHVVDLARGHVQALERQQQQVQPEHLVVNLGTGKGYSVLEVVRAFEQASKRQVPYAVAPRRPGDVATCYAKTDKAQAMLNWRAQFDIDRMCADAWRWQSHNPDGYQAGC